MNKLLKIRWEERHKIYVATDFHCFHDPKTWDVPIWKLRGYESALHAAEETQKSINKKVGENDYLFVLGDGFLNATDEQVVEWWRGINCKNIFYEFGNHESQMFRIYRQEVAKIFNQDIEVYPFKWNNITFVGNYLELKVGSQMVIMSHFPFRIHNYAHHGSWGLSAHSHLNDKGRRPEAPNGKSLDCGWDYKKEPWSWAEIEDVMSTKSVERLDHHDQNTN